jgi:hypothetical protein
MLETKAGHLHILLSPQDHQYGGSLCAELAGLNGNRTTILHFLRHTRHPRESSYQWRAGSTSNPNMTINTYEAGKEPSCSIREKPAIPTSTSGIDILKDDRTVPAL